MLGSRVRWPETLTVVRTPVYDGSGWCGRESHSLRQFFFLGLSFELGGLRFDGWLDGLSLYRLIIDPWKNLLAMLTSFMDNTGLSGGEENVEIHGSIRSGRNARL